MMSRNQNSHFSLNPTANIKRSRMDISHSVKLTCNAGKLVPFELKEILPGDTFDINTSILARMQTLTVPLMDDLYIDTYYFFVPNRILWKHWQQFMGESDTPWYDDTAYSVPTIMFDTFPNKTGGVESYVHKGSVADYLGLPLPNFTADDAATNGRSQEVSHLPFRAYVKVWNDWFRNENIQDFATFNTEDAGVSMGVDNDAWYGMDLLPVNKYKDYFTSSLPQPQKGPEVTIGVGQTAPVFAATANNDLTDYSFGALRFVRFDGNDFTTGYHDLQLYSPASNNEYAYTTHDTATIGTGTHKDITPANLVADISAATGISINELRLAFATQKFYEQAARGGTRYIEILDSMFGVTNGDLRLQRPEYLGGNRLTVNINQAIQNSETGSTPLGNIGAYSLTTDSQHSFTKSFTEHGILLGLLCIRYDHSYNQGIPKFWSKVDKFDFYWPAFNGIGEQPTLNKEIFFSGTDADEEVFGYQEAYADYRYANNVLLGEMRTNYDQSLDFWHLGDDYDSLPTLSEEWIVEDGETIDRTLAVTSEVSDQFLVDMYINTIATRPMPLFSVPGMDIL